MRMSRIKTEYFLNELQKRIDELGLSIPELEAKSGVYNSGLYMLFQGRKKSVDRSTFRALADAVEMDFKISGDVGKLTKRLPVDAANKNGAGDRRGEKLEEILHEMSDEHYEAVERFATIVATMSKEEIIDLNQAWDQLDLGKNKAVFLKKLRAFADIIQPYGSMKKSNEGKKS